MWSVIRVESSGRATAALLISAPFLPLLIFYFETGLPRLPLPLLCSPSCPATYGSQACATISGHFFQFSHVWLSTDPFLRSALGHHVLFLLASKLRVEVDGWTDMVCKSMVEEGGEHWFGLNSVFHLAQGSRTQAYLQVQPGIWRQYSLCPCQGPLNLRFLGLLLPRLELISKNAEKPTPMLSMCLVFSLDGFFLATPVLGSSLCPSYSIHIHTS